MKHVSKIILKIVLFVILFSAAFCYRGFSDISSLTEGGGRGGLTKAISLDLREINVVDVLKFLAKEGSLNIVTSKNVQGRSTLLLRNVTIQDALDIIVISNQLAYHMMNDIIYVMTESEYLQLYGKSYSDQKSIATRTLKYAKPSYVLTVLQSVQSSIGKVIVDEETGSVIMIDTKEKIKRMNEVLDEIETKTETKVIKLNYAKAKDVETQLKAKLDAKAVGSIMADERSNQIIVSAYPERMSDILPVIQSLDRRTRAVLIDARILQVTINPQFDYGIDWEKTFTDTNLGEGKFDRYNKIARSLDIQSFSPISTTISGGSTFGKIAVGSLSANEFTLQLQALKQVQKTNVLANPRLTILDRQEAKINIGDKIPYVVTTTTGTGSNVSVSEDIKFIDVGISLVVTPIINDEDVITMKIRPEISSRTGTLTTPASAEIPLVNTTFVESNVLVKDGKTIILGGLRRDDMTQNDKGIPFFMDIPIIGHAFKSRASEATKSEIVIFITPKIIDPEKNLATEVLDIKPIKPLVKNANEK